MTTILIRLSADQAPEPDLIHRFRNYGEDVHRHLRESGEKMGEADIEEIDAATTEFSVRGVSRAKSRRLCLWLEQEALRQNLMLSADVQ